MRNLVSFALAVIPSICMPAQLWAESQLQVWHIRNWSGALVLNSDERFERCNAVTAYADGLSLGFAINADGHVSVRLTNDNWNLTKSGPISVLYTVGGISGSLIGIANSTYQAMFDVDRGNSFLQSIRRNYAVVLSSPEIGDWSLDLRDSAPALKRMARCASDFAQAVNQSVSGSQEPGSNPAHGGRQVKISIEGHSISSLGIDAASMSQSAGDFSNIDY